MLAVEHHNPFVIAGVEHTHQGVACASSNRQCGDLVGLAIEQIDFRTRTNHALDHGVVRIGADRFMHVQIQLAKDPGHVANIGRSGIGLASGGKPPEGPIQAHLDLQSRM